MAFVPDYDIDSGTLDVVNHKDYDYYASTAYTLGKVTNTTRLCGGEKEKKMLDFGVWW